MQIFVFSFLGAPNVFAQFVEFKSFVPYKTTKKPSTANKSSI